MQGGNVVSRMQVMPEKILRDEIIFVCLRLPHKKPHWSFDKPPTMASKRHVMFMSGLSKLFQN